MVRLKSSCNSIKPSTVTVSHWPVGWNIRWQSQILPAQFNGCDYLYFLRTHLLGLWENVSFSTFITATHDNKRNYPSPQDTWACRQGYVPEMELADEPFWRSCQVCSYSCISQHFMKPEGSLPCSQESSTGPYPEPDAEMHKRLTLVK
jgi:hypothetical protein